MQRSANWLRPAVWGFYAVVVLEFLFMISPLALHFYAGYAPVLNLLRRWPASAWLTGFFLPHFSNTWSPLLNGLKPAGFLLAALGLLVFAAGAAQIYGAKLLRRGAVTGGLYRLVRHPQYLGFTVLGFGVTLIWPRFLVLVSFVSMTFVYGALARWEERRCVERYGDDYRDYQRRTGRIVPRFFSAGESATVTAPPWKLPLWWLATLAMSLVAAFGLRAYSISRLAAVFMTDVAILSPAALDSAELRAAYRTARMDAEVGAIVGDEGKLLVYVIPLGWYLPDLPLDTEEEIRRVGGGHRTPAVERGKYRVLFTRPRLHARGATGKEIVARAHGLEPLAIVRVDLLSATVTGRDAMPDHVVWGDIPTPLF